MHAFVRLGQQTTHNATESAVKMKLMFTWQRVGLFHDDTTKVGTLIQRTLMLEVLDVVNVPWIAVVEY